MEQIKQSILEGTEAVDTEKQKNVSLLNMIFPAKIAMKLWKGIIEFEIILFTKSAIKYLK